MYMKIIFKKYTNCTFGTLLVYNINTNFNSICINNNNLY